MRPDYALPVYNPRIRANGRTTAELYAWGEVKRIKKIEIGKQSRGDELFLIDTIVHEELEARIMIRKSKKYIALNDTTDVRRHRHINAVIERYFKLKGWKS